MAYTNYYSAGAVAEQVVHTKLQALPSDYHVFQNIDAGTGESFTELDFAVVTPTGAFVLLEDELPRTYVHGFLGTHPQF